MDLAREVEAYLQDNPVVVINKLFMRFTDPLSLMAAIRGNSAIGVLGPFVYLKEAVGSSNSHKTSTYTCLMKLYYL